ncbi:MAG: hypothetical protein ABIJ46_02005 [bacterium]
MTESETLKSDATRLLRHLDLVGRLEKFGHVRPTGSYAADLMTVPDIDLYVVGQWDRAAVRKIFVGLLDALPVKGLLFFDWVRYRHPDFPRAYYIGIKDNFRGRKWKVDIWFLTERQVKSLPYADWSQVEVSPTQRRAIIGFKEYRDRRGLAIPSFMVYEAVLRHGLLKRQEIEEYCRGDADNK